MKDKLNYLSFLANGVAEQMKKESEEVDKQSLFDHLKSWKKTRHLKKADLADFMDENFSDKDLKSIIILLLEQMIDLDTRLKNIEDEYGYFEDDEDEDDE